VFYYVYVLQSDKDGMRCVGYTNNLERRLEQCHRAGKVPSTRKRLSVQLVYYEGCSGTREISENGLGKEIPEE